MNCVQICLVLATSCLMLVSANPTNLNEHRDTRDCNDQIQVSEPIVVASKSYVAEPIVSSVTVGPVLQNAEFDSTRILAAAPVLEAKIDAEPLLYAARPNYAPLIKSAPIPEYFAASPAPLVASRLQSPIVQVQAAPAKIFKSAPLESYSVQSTSSSHKSFVNHPSSSVKIAAIAPQYYAAAPAAPEYYAPAPVAPEYYAPAPVAPAYYAHAPVAPAYYAAAPAPIAAVKIASPVARTEYAAVPIQQAKPALVVPPAQYAYRSVSSPATSYQYANNWNNQVVGLQSRYYASSPQYYSAPAIQAQNYVQYDAQEQPCEK